MGRRLITRVQVRMERLIRTAQTQGGECSA